MHWRIKGVLQKILGVMPYGHELHYRLQRNFGGMRDIRRECILKIDDWAIMAEHMRNAGLRIPGARLAEIGTGWYPTLPLACYLSGASEVHTFDLNRLLKPELVARCIEVLGEQLPRIIDISGADAESVQARYRRLQAAADTSDLSRLSEGVIRYHAPIDFTASGLPDGAVDAVFSNSVLEHVPPEVVRPIYDAAMRLLAPGGLMFHSVNCGDHYAYIDRKIHQLHYLRFSDAQWAFWNNAFLYQNRLRAHVFVDAARDAGFEIALDTSNPRPERMKQLAEMPVHPQFAHIPPEKLCLSTVDFIGRKAKG